MISVGKAVVSPAVSTGAVRRRSGTERVIGPSPWIWRSAGTGLRSHGNASPAPPSSISDSGVLSESAKSSDSRSSRLTIPPCLTPSDARRSAHQASVASPPTRNVVSEMLLLPRCSCAARGMSNTVMSDPGDPAPSPKNR